MELKQFNHVFFTLTANISEQHTTYLSSGVCIRSVVNWSLYPCRNKSLDKCDIAHVCLLWSADQSKHTYLTPHWAVGEASEQTKTQTHTHTDHSHRTGTKLQKISLQLHTHTRRCKLTSTRPASNVDDLGRWHWRSHVKFSQLSSILHSMCKQVPDEKLHLHVSSTISLLTVTA